MKKRNLIALIIIGLFLVNLSFVFAERVCRDDAELGNCCYEGSLQSLSEGAYYTWWPITGWDPPEPAGMEVYWKWGNIDLNVRDHNPDPRYVPIDVEITQEDFPNNPELLGYLYNRGELKGSAESGQEGYGTATFELCRNAICGDDEAKSEEACDGVDLKEATCASRGYDSGTISCLDDCSGFDESDCISETGEVNPCSNEDEIIMKLFASDNSHGALFDDVNYKYNICSPFEGLVLNRDDCDNPILWLASDTNSHVSENEIAESYEVPVCYSDDLICEIKQDCDEEEECVVTLNALTNSHLAACDSDNKYDWEICCKIEDLGEFYWTDFVGNEISSTSVGRIVKLVVGKEEIKDLEINYMIMEVDGGWLWFDSEVAQETSIGWLEWSPNETGEYYFIAEVGGKEYNSKDLGGDYGVLEVVERGENHVPEVEIMGPENAQLYKVNQEISFEHHIVDEGGDIVSVVWDFGGDVEIEGIEGGVQNILLEADEINNDLIVKYKNPGYYVISLTATDNENTIGEDYIVIGVLE